MNNWKDFHIDVNVAFGPVFTKQDWENMIKDVASQPGFTGLKHAETYLLTTKRNLNCTDYPSFSFSLSACGETLAEFLGENNYE